MAFRVVWAFWPVVIHSDLSKKSLTLGAMCVILFICLLYMLTLFDESFYESGKTISQDSTIFLCRIVFTYIFQVGNQIVS